MHMHDFKYFLCTTTIWRHPECLSNYIEYQELTQTQSSGFFMPKHKNHPILIIFMMAVQCFSEFRYILQTLCMTKFVCTLIYIYPVKLLVLFPLDKPRQFPSMYSSCSLYVRICQLELDGFGGHKYFHLY